MYLFKKFLAVLGLCCRMMAFSSFDEQGLLFDVLHQASHCGNFCCCGAQALGSWASEVTAHGLSSWDFWALECGLSGCGAWS